MTTRAHKRVRGDGSGTSSDPATEVSGRWATINLHRMTHFPVGDDFLHLCPLARMGIDLLNERQLGGLCGPFPPIYPRIVRLFYQNLRQDIRESSSGRNVEFYHTTVDDCYVELDSNTLAETLAIYGSLVDELSTDREPIPENISLTDMAMAVSENRSPPGNNFVRHGELAERLWFVDTVLKANVFHGIHKDERRNDNLQALYALHAGYEFSFADLMIREMKRMVNCPRNPRGQEISLPYANIIAAYLQHATTDTQHPFIISPNELQDHHNNVYPPGNWTKSTAAFAKRQAPNAPPPTRRRGPSSSASSAQPEAPWVFTRDDYDQLRSDIHRIDRRFERLEDSYALQTEYMRRMMDAMGLREPLPESTHPPPPQ